MTAPQLAPGTVLSGRTYTFSVQSLIAHSGSTATYRAISSANSEAMVKVFDPAVRQRPDITAAMERLYAEAIQLPGDVIVHVLEAGYDPTTGAPFSATPLVPLPSLTQFCARRPMSAQEVAAMLKSMARGLDAAHIRQVCHHALKPTNIFVGNAPNVDVKITDFGAGLVRAAVPTHEAYVQAAPWMAPEQVQQGGQPGPAADIFAAGLLAFYALTGRSFWRAMGGAQPDLNAWQQELFGGRVVASLRASELAVPLSQALDAVFSRALASDPRQRYRTVGELAAAFDAAANQRQEVGATMAFPAIGADMPPPPAPPAPPGQGPQMAAPAQPAQPANAGWSGQPGQGQPDAPRGVGHAGLATMVPPGGSLGVDRGRPKTSKAVPIFLGIAAVVLVGGAVAAVMFLGKDDTPPPSTVTPTSSGPPTATASDTPTAATSATATSTATTSAAPGPEAGVTFKCAPTACDSVQVDGTAVSDLAQPTKLAVGKHTISAAKDGFNAYEESVEVEALSPTELKLTFKREGAPQDTATARDGKPVERKLTLTAAKPVASTTATTPTTTTRTSTGTGTKTGAKCVPSKFKKCPK